MKTTINTQSKALAVRYNVLSPDGFSIFRELDYKDKKSAREALNEWVRNYQRQGYYSSNNGRISLNDLPAHCDIVEIPMKETDKIYQIAYEKTPKCVLAWFQNKYPPIDGYTFHFYKYYSGTETVYGCQVNYFGVFHTNAHQGTKKEFAQK